MLQEHKEQIKYVLVAIVVLSFAYAVYQYGQSVNSAYSTRTFTVEGKAKVESENNVATFNATVLTEGGMDQVAVQTQNTEKMNTVIAYLEKEGIDKKDIKTEQYTLMPKYNYAPCYAGNCPEPKISGYTVSQAVTVKVRTVENAGKLVAGVVQNGATTVSEIRFEADNRDEALKQARIEALADAEAQAKRLSKAGNFRLGKLVTFYDQGEGMGEPYPMGGVEGDVMMAKSAVPAPPVLAPGVSDEEVRVTVTYEIR
jgi:uncharacterized protein YggE